jgi:hypothetical protein
MVLVFPLTLHLPQLLVSLDIFLADRARLVSLLSAARQPFGRPALNRLLLSYRALPLPSRLLNVSIRGEFAARVIPGIFSLQTHSFRSHFRISIWETTRKVGEVGAPG